MAGQIFPTTTAAGTVSYPYASYEPTLVEISLFVGGLALLALAYTLAERYLDMGETDVHVGINWPWVRRHDAAHDPAELHDIPVAVSPAPDIAGPSPAPVDVAAMRLGVQS